MTYDLLPGLTYLLVALFTVAGVATALSLAALADSLIRHHARRVARHESIPVYYRQLVLAH
jgi:hypothetical protein